MKDLDSGGNTITLGQLGDSDPLSINGNITGEKLKKTWNNEGPSILSLFEDQVSRTPDSISLISPSENVTLTYVQLNALSSRLAFNLFSIIGDDFDADENQERPIGICLPRCASMVISTLGVLKTGHPYLSLDPYGPTRQCLFMLENSNSIAVIAPAKLKTRLSSFTGKFIEIETLIPSQSLIEVNLDPTFGIPNVPLHSPDVISAKGANIKSSNLAYIMYTSGSTGQPKGVQIEHLSLLNRLSISHLCPQSSDSVLFLSSPTFDNSVFEIFSTLTSGARLVIAPSFIELDIPTLSNLIVQEKITVLQIVPSLLNELVSSRKAEETLKSVKLLITGGEPLTYSLCTRTLEVLPSTSDFYNIYGVTEATIDSTYWKCTLAPFLSSSGTFTQGIIPIGKALCDSIQVYVLNSDLEPSIEGNVGEIYIGGAGLARGYILNSGAANNAFIEGPFTSKEIKSSRLYKTGDLARLLPDGNIEYVGRRDTQVKVNGVRVELGQIESIIMKQPEVNQVVVVLNKSQIPSKSILVAYLKFWDEKITQNFSKNSKEFSEIVSQLENNLKSEISEKVIPTVFIPLKEFPLSPSGKVDRVALQERDVQFTLEPYEGPKTEIESILCKIAQEILKVKGYGINDNFFRLGGDSIAAMRFCAVAGQEYGIEIKVLDIFKCPTVAELSPRCNSTLTLELKEEIERPIISNDLWYPLSPLQSGLLFNSLYKGRSDEYLIRTLIKVEGDFNTEVFKKAWMIGIEKYSALRTSFEWEGRDKPVQVVHPPQGAFINERNWKVVNQDFPPLTCDNKNEVVDAIVFHPECINQINLGVAPLMTWTLLKTNLCHYFLWRAHHIILDGWSISLVLSDIFEIYRDLCTLTVPNMIRIDPCLNQVQNDRSSYINVFWEEYLKDLEPQPPLPILSTSESSSVSSAYEVIEFDLRSSLSERLRSLSKQCEVTIHTVFQGAWAILLSRYLGQRDILFGTTVSTRPSPSSCAVGLFINTIPCRVKVCEEDSLQEFLHRVQENSVSLTEVSAETELYKIKELKKRPQSSGYFDTLFVFENYPDSFATKGQLNGITIEEIKVWDATEYPLTLAVVPCNSERSSTQLALSFKTDILSSESIERLAHHFESILISMVSNESSSKIANLEILSQSERNKILESGMSQTNDNLRSKGTICDLIEEMCIQYPDAVAISSPDGSQVSYKELSKTSSQFANYLSNKVCEDLQTEDIIGICCDKSPDLFIALLGILKSSAAFLPLDPANPEDRLRYMVQNSGAKVIIVEEKYRPTFEKLRGDSNKSPVIVTLEEVMERSCEPSSLEFSLKRVKQSNLAYVMYTSGTTGRPKGVQIEHKGIANLALHFKRTFDLSPTSRILQFASIGFDAFVSEWAMAFASGATLSLPKYGKEKVMGENLIDLLAKEKVTCVTLPPSTLSTISDEVTTVLPHLKTIVVAGEMGDLNSFERWSSAGKEVYNAYGPTEGTVCTTLKRYGPGVKVNNIGQPISNTKVFILDNLERPVPYGVFGEICITGVGLTRGYRSNNVNDDLPLSKAFLPNPWNRNKLEAFETLYKTGDMGRLLSNGDVEIIGRVDEQVKLRGFRIELKEIENAILTCMKETVRSVCVIQREDSPRQKRLVAYLVPYHKDKNPDTFDLNASQLPLKVTQVLKEILPEYMIPKFFVVLQKLPQTLNGKVDKRALPLPTVSWNDGRIISEVRKEPFKEVEKLLHKIWSDLLGISPIGICDNFFQIGGDSILCIFMRNQAQKVGIYLTVKEIFENPTISQLSALIERDLKSNNYFPSTLSSSHPSCEPHSLTPIQKWFFELNLANRNYWNQSILLRPKEPLNEVHLEKAINSLVEHHETLRAHFKFESPNEVSPQSMEYLAINKIGKSILKVIDLRTLKGPDDVTEGLYEEIIKVQSGFDLTKGPLFAAILFNLQSNKEQRLFLCAHHTVVDSISWKILVDDLTQLYAAGVKGQPMECILTPSTSFSQWAEMLRKLTSSKDFFLEDIEYWKREGELADSLDIAVIPGGPLDKEEEGFSIHSLRINFSEHFTSKLVHEANKLYKTKTNELLLTAWAQVVIEEFRQNYLHIAIEGHGREDNIFDLDLPTLDLSRTVGWFTSIYPLIIKLKNPEDISGSIKEVKDKLRLVPRQGITYGPLCYLSEEKVEVQSPIMSFNYTGILDPSIGNFELALEDLSETDVSPKNRLPYPLALDIEIHHKSLQVLVTYDRSLFTEELVKKLSEAFEIRLNDIINHCLVQGPQNLWTWSVSDFPLLSKGPNPILKDQKQLDQIRNNLACSNYLEDMYPLAPTQSDILMSCLLQEKAKGHSEAGENFVHQRDVYVSQTVNKIEGTFSLQEFQKAWERALEEFEILRTGFVSSVFEQPVQFVVKSQKVAIPWIIHHLSSAEQQQQVDKELEVILDLDKMNPFCFWKPPLMRAIVVKVHSKLSYFIWTFHHIILDGWSASIMLKRVNQIYNELVGKEVNKYPSQNSARHSFKKFISSVNSNLRNESKEFWLNYLKDVESTKFLQIKRSTNFNVDHCSNSDLHFKANLTLRAEEAGRLQKFAQDNSATLNTLMQSVWSLILYLYSSKRDIVFGTVLSGRQSSGRFNDTVGLLISTVPLRVKIDPDWTFESLLREVKKEMTKIQGERGISLSEIKGALGVGSGSDLFDTLFVFENYPDESNELVSLNGEGKMTLVKVNEGTEFPMTVMILPEMDGTLRVEFSAAKGHFDVKSLERLVGHFKTICVNLVRPDVKISCIPWMTLEEGEQLKKFNNALTVEEKWDLENLTIPQLFEDQVELCGNEIAVQLEDKCVTYNLLNSMANQWAHFLRSEGVCQGSLVAVCLERSINLIAALIGILKAGGAYVPLDPCYPAQRITTMLQDSQPLILITDENLNSQYFKGYLGQKATLEVILPTLGNFPRENIKCEVKGKSLAYVMYTSGSTGVPKGVGMEDACITNLFKSTQVTSPIGPGDKILVKISLSFDVSVSEIFWPLSTGAQLVLLPSTCHNDISLMAKCIKEAKVTVIRMVPSVLSALLQLEDISSMCRSLRIIICSGEALTQQTFSKAMTLLPNLDLLSNKYGPTETHEVTTWEGTRELFLNNSYPNIGIPFHNCKILILNEYLQPLPVGLVGEIYIGGVCLARGYLNRPEVTDEKFIRNPFESEIFGEGIGTRLYKTGDLGRFLENGEIEYLGRIDHQVKVRGYRIELEEVGKALMSKVESSSLVDDCLVSCTQNNLGENVLIAYVIPSKSSGKLVDKAKVADELKRRLKKQLPEFMIPSVLFVLDKFPLTSNGKIDRGKLPNIGDSFDEGSNLYDVEPMSGVEMQFAWIWGKALGLSRQVTREDNFFYLGGHSLLAMKVKWLVQKELGIDVDIRTIFDFPVFGQWTEEVIKDKHLFNFTNDKSCDLEMPDEELNLKNRGTLSPLTSQQHNLWILSKLIPDEKPVYTIPIILKYTGHFDTSKLKKALNLVSLHHPSLRSIFPEKDGQPWEQILSEPNYHFESMEISSWDLIQRKVHSFVGLPFELEKGPLFRCLVIKESDQIHHVIFTFHHIVIDDESCKVFLEDLMKHYEEAPVNFKPSLFPLPLKRPLTSSIDTEMQINYWKKELEGLDDLVINLPYDHPRPPVLTYEGRSYNFQISNEVTENLLKLSYKNKTTLFQVYLSAFQIFLYKYASSPEVVLLGLPISNRDRNNPYIGFFVNTVVVKATFDERSESNEPLTFNKFLQQTREKTLEALNNSNVPFDIVCKRVSGKRRANTNPFFQVMFSFTSTERDEEEFLNDLVPSDLKVEIQNLESQVSKFDLTLSAHVEGNKSTSFCFEYSTDLFEYGTIKRMSMHFVNLLTQISRSEDKENEGLSLSSLNLMSNSEMSRLTSSHQGKRSGLSKENVENFVSILEMFEYQAKCIPSAMAVNNGITYSELESRVNKFTDYLINDLKVPTKSNVAFCLDRSEHFGMYLLGTLKAGCIYVPIDPSLPYQRISSIIKDCCPSVLFVGEEFKGQEDFGDMRIVQVSGVEATIQRNVSKALNKVLEVRKSDPDDLAYIIYTSGSTGKPKGVANTHRALANWVESVQDKIPLSPEGDSVLFMTSVGFDVSISEIIWPLTSGSRLVVAPPHLEKDLFRLSKFIEVEKVTVIRGVPTMLSLLTHPDANLVYLSQSPLRVAISAGEALSYEMALRILQNLPNIDLYNMYGATETGIDATIWKVDPSYSKIIVGEPFHNVDLYVTDRNMNLVPEGIIGEICVSGASLATRYINLPEETEGRFVKNPWKLGLQNDIFSRVYKTGDIGRVLSDGSIECLGRLDSQVKLRGFRIELGEIENVILKESFIQQAVAFVTSSPKESVSGSEFITAFVQLTMTEDQVRMRERLDKSLKESLPYYMVPSQIIFVEEIPKTSSGKLDRRALKGLLVSLSMPESVPLPSPPQTKLEQTLTSIWEEVIGCPEGSIGIHDNFFTVGGHSVLAVQAARAIEQMLVSISIPVFYIYKYPTVSSLARAIEEEEELKDVNTTREEIVHLPKLPENVVPINDQGSLPPLILIHPSLALACDFLNIPILNKEQPIYGINNPRYGVELDEGFSSLEEMITLYLKIIKEVRPFGPYRLGGWCFGGTISLEIARVLESQGQVVEVVILIDTFNIPQRFIKEAFGKETQDRSSFSTEKKALRMLEGWEQKGYGGKVVLFKARDLGLSPEELAGSEGKDDDEDLVIMKSVYNGWENLLEKLEVFSVPGNNDTLLDFPNVTEFGRILYQVIESLGDEANKGPYKAEVPLGIHERTLVNAMKYGDEYIIQRVLPLVNKKDICPISRTFD